MAAMMEGYVNKVVQVVTNDGRNIVGVLKGFDQTTNIILEDCNERVFSSTTGVEQVALGLYIVRGDNMCACHSNQSRSLPSAPSCTPVHHLTTRCVRSAVVGEVNEEADAELQLDEIVAEPLKPIVH